jgi:NAD-dependent deacetylase
MTLTLDDQTSLLCLTGAGVSAESGLPTFRDANGLWENHPVEEVASPQGFARNPRLVWRFYSQRREAATGCRPNPGHLALAALERVLGERFLLVTQNVDGLHRQAGSERLIELHGNLHTSRCSRCDRPPFTDNALYFDEPPACDRCKKGLLRPHIVWFGEALFPGHWEGIERFLRNASGRGRVIFLAAGTSGTVYPAAGLVEVARSVGAETWLVNVDAPENASAFDHFVQARSGEALPTLLKTP